MKGWTEVVGSSNIPEMYLNKRAKPLVMATVKPLPSTVVVAQSPDVVQQYENRIVFHANSKTVRTSDAHISLWQPHCFLSMHVARMLKQFGQHTCTARMR